MGPITKGEPDMMDKLEALDLVRQIALPDTEPTVLRALADLVANLPDGDPGDSLENLAAAYDLARKILANSTVLERDHGSVNPFRAAVDMLERPTDDGAPAPAPAPDPFTGDQHRVKRGRNKRGTTAIVTGRGVGQVIGARFRAADGTSIIPTDVVDRLLSLRRRGNGWNVLDVTRAADDLYDLPTLEGSDAEVWANVVDTDVSDLSDIAPVGRFRTDLVSYLSDDLLALERDVYRAQTSNGTARDSVTAPSLARFPARVRTVRPRKRASEVPNLAPFYGIRAYCRPFHRVSLDDLVTGRGQTLLLGGTSVPGDQDAPVFIGHSPLLPRGVVSEPTRGNRERKTVASALPVPETEAGWQVWADSLEPEQRLTFRDRERGVRVTLTRTRGKRFTSTVVYDSMTVRFAGVRTSTGIARKLALALQ